MTVMILDELERLGLLERRPVTPNRRGCVVVSTRAGREMLALAETVVRTIEQGAPAKHSDDEQHTSPCTALCFASRTS